MHQRVRSPRELIDLVVLSSRSKQEQLLKEDVQSSVCCPSITCALVYWKREYPISARECNPKRIKKNEEAMSKFTEAAYEVGLKIDF